METPVTERVTDARFWAIVEEIGWPHVDPDAAKLLLMRAYPPSVMEAMHAAFHRRTADLARAAAVDWCCDSWDDNRAHIVGLGAEVYACNLENPHLMLQRMERGEYKESFAYCLPFSEDYGLLTDSGYEKSLGRVQTFLADLDSADPDEIPPRLYRRFAEARQVCNLLVDRKWAEAVAAYHRACGPGYDDDWPFSAWCGHLIPNIVCNLERYRLAGEGQDARSVTDGPESPRIKQ